MSWPSVFLQLASSLPAGVWCPRQSNFETLALLSLAFGVGGCCGFFAGALVFCAGFRAFIRRVLQLAVSDRIVEVQRPRDRLRLYAD